MRKVNRPYNASMKSFFFFFFGAEGLQREKETKDMDSIFFMNDNTNFIKTKRQYTFSFLWGKPSADIFNNLQGKYPKASLVKILDRLIIQNDIYSKTYGKTNIYSVKQVIIKRMSMSMKVYA